MARLRQTPDLAHSPASSQSSDKENTRSRDESRGQKRRSDGTTMSESSRPASAAGPSKRRHLEERSRRLSSQAAHQRELNQRVDKQFYDPDQDEEERRQNKKEMRDLTKALNDSRAEYLQAQSRGLVKTLVKADALFKNVKQTSDATIDSRLLVTAADLSYKKINELTLGDSSVGVDIDEYVSKCIIFMKKGSEAERNREARDIDPTQPTSTQTQRRHRRQTQVDDDEEGDAMDWDYLGRNAAFLANSRPCLSGFMLGPLSVQKKVRQPTQRRAREARADLTQALRPVVLDDEALKDKEDTSLADQCKGIRKLLVRTAARGMEAFDKEYSESMTEDDAQALMRKHHIADIEGGVPLFDFIINPKSFGQTVENMFYVSFLIKEGSAGLDFDSRGMPVLQAAEPKSLQERQKLPRNQAVFTLDFDMWRDIIESCGITESVIPHADERDYDDGTTRDEGWHG